MKITSICNDGFDGVRVGFALGFTNAIDAPLQALSKGQGDQRFIINDVITPVAMATSAKSLPTWTHCWPRGGAARW